MRTPIALATAALFVLAGALAEAQSPMRIRGTITALEGSVLSVKSRDGKDLKINLADNLAVSGTKAIGMADIKPGDYVGSATMKRPDGTLVALEVHLFPAALRGVVPEGHIPWDLEPGSMMTNATLGSVVQAAGGREITLQYKDGSQKILVPEGTPMATSVPGDRSLLVPGAYVFMVAQVAPDGKISAARIQASKDGVKPPQ
ncbi:MAG TPA: hypothetical protein VIG69_14750 [Candidatus Methylomirabilis sp.]